MRTEDEHAVSLAEIITLENSILNHLLIQDRQAFLGLHKYIICVSVLMCSGENMRHECRFQWMQGTCVLQYLECMHLSPLIKQLRGVVAAL